MTPEPVLTIKSTLGEGPVWSQDKHMLYWLDVFLPALNRFDPTTGINQATQLSQPIYAMVLREGGGAIGVVRGRHRISSILIAARST